MELFAVMIMAKHWEDVSDRVSFPRGTRHGTAFYRREGCT